MIENDSCQYNLKFRYTDGVTAARRQRNLGHVLRYFFLLLFFSIIFFLTLVCACISILFTAIFSMAVSPALVTQEQEQTASVSNAAGTMETKQSYIIFTQVKLGTEFFIMLRILLIFIY